MKVNYMREGPDISKVASLIGDPARANILTALLSGKALTARELACEAAVTAQTASAHLSKLVEGKLVSFNASGRHRYYKLMDEDVASLLESIMVFAASKDILKIRTGPKDVQLREARICYNHLAGEMGIALFDGLLRNGAIEVEGEYIGLGDTEIFETLEIDLASLQKQRRPILRLCLDWSMRRHHLAGSLAQAVLERFVELGWAKRVDGTRIIEFTPNGRKSFENLLA